MLRPSWRARPAYIVERMRREAVQQLASKDVTAYEVGLTKVEEMYEALDAADLVRLLASRLKAKDPWIRERTAMTLAEVATPSTATDALALAADDPDPAVRDYACQALSRNANVTAARRHLRRKLTDSDDQVRCSALRGLSVSSHRVAMQIVKRCLSDGSPLVRLAALEALGRGRENRSVWGRRIAAVITEHLAGERDEMVQCEAHRCLYVMGPDRRRLDELVRLGASRLKGVRMRVYGTLGDLAACGDVDQIRRALAELERKEASLTQRQYIRSIATRLQLTVGSKTEACGRI